MFNKISSHKAARLTSLILILALAMPMYGAPLFPQKAMAQSTDESLLTSVAVIGFQNNTSYNILGNDRGIGFIMSEAAKLGVEEKEKIRFIAKDKVLGELGSAASIDESLALETGENLDAEQIIYGVVEQASVKGTEYASVVIDLYIMDVGAGTLISRSRVLGEKALRGFAGTEEQLLQKAVSEGVTKALNEALENQYKYGIVTTVSGDTIQVNLSQRDGLVKGATLAVLNEAEQIAVIEIKEASIGYSRGQVSQVLGREAIRGGQKVRLIYNPRQISAEISAVDMQKRKKKFGNTALLVLGAIALASSLSGSSKGAEPPKPASGPEVIASSDGAAAVYAAAGFHRDYIPNPPSKISNVASSALAACNTATNCNQDVCIVSGTAYNFSLATSPQNPNFPTSYTIGFDLTGKTLSASDQSNMKIATCNADTGEWELYSATYGRCSWLGNKFCASAAVAHFTPYAVVIDNRPAPLPAPSNFTVGCSDSKAILSWSKIQDTNNIGYRVYNCSAASCTTP